MAGDIGYSFSPGAASEGRLSRSGGAGYGMSPQEAVRILSLRIPERASPNAIAPLPLLTSKGSGAAGAQGLDTLVAALMRALKPPMAPNAGPQVPSPVPNAGGSPDAGGGDGGGGAANPVDTYRDWLRRERGPDEFAAPVVDVPPAQGALPALPGLGPTPPRIIPGKELPGDDPAFPIQDVPPLPVGDFFVRDFQPSPEAPMPAPARNPRWLDKYEGDWNPGVTPLF